MECSAAWGLKVKVVVVKTPPTSSLPKRAVRILESIAATCRSRHAATVHLIGDSSDGIDATNRRGAVDGRATLYSGECIGRTPWA